jgi:hypothetical protein
MGHGDQRWRRRIGALIGDLNDATESRFIALKAHDAEEYRTPLGMTGFGFAVGTPSF